MKKLTRVKMRNVKGGGNESGGGTGAYGKCCVKTNPTDCSACTQAITCNSNADFVAC